MSKNYYKLLQIAAQATEGCVPAETLLKEADSKPTPAKDTYNIRSEQELYGTTPASITTSINMPKSLAALALMSLGTGSIYFLAEKRRKDKEKKERLNYLNSENMMDDELGRRTTTIDMSQVSNKEAGLYKQSALDFSAPWKMKPLGTQGIAQEAPVVFRTDDFKNGWASTGQALDRLGSAKWPAAIAAGSVILPFSFAAGALLARGVDETSKGISGSDPTNVNARLKRRVKKEYAEHQKLLSELRSVMNDDDANASLEKDAAALGDGLKVIRSIGSMIRHPFSPIVHFRARMAPIHPGGSYAENLYNATRGTNGFKNHVPTANMQVRLNATETAFRDMPELLFRRAPSDRLSAATDNVDKLTKAVEAAQEQLRLAQNIYNSSATYGITGKALNSLDAAVASARGTLKSAQEALTEAQASFKTIFDDWVVTTGGPVLDDAVRSQVSDAFYRVQLNPSPENIANLKRVAPHMSSAIDDAAAPLLANPTRLRSERFCDGTKAFGRFVGNGIMKNLLVPMVQHPGKTTLGLTTGAIGLHDVGSSAWTALGGKWDPNRLWSVGIAKYLGGGLYSGAKDVGNDVRTCVNDLGSNITQSFDERTERIINAMQGNSAEGYKVPLGANSTLVKGTVGLMALCAVPFIATSALKATSGFTKGVDDGYRSASETPAVQAMQAWKSTLGNREMGIDTPQALLVSEEANKRKKKKRKPSKSKE